MNRTVGTDFFPIRVKKLTALFVEAQQGNLESYHLLLKKVMEMLEKYYGRLLAKIGSVGSLQSADLVQETLLATHQKRGTFDPRSPFGPWLFAIARYKFVDFVRKNLRERVAFDWDALESSLLADTKTEEFDVHEDLESVLGMLPEKQSRLLRLLKLEGKSVKEVSESTGMSETALKVTVHRAIKALKTRMRQELK